MKKSKTLVVFGLILIVISIVIGNYIYLQSDKINKNVVQPKIFEENDDSDNKKDNEGDKSDEIIEGKDDRKEIVIGKKIDLEDFAITIKNLSIGKCLEDKDTLIIDYSWENNSEKSLIPFTSFSIKGYQDNVETDYSMLVEDIDLEKGQKDVKPGGKIENAQTSIGIDSMEAPLEIELTRLLSFDDDIYYIIVNPAELDKQIVD